MNQFKDSLARAAMAKVKYEQTEMILNLFGYLTCAFAAVGCALLFAFTHQ